jgi:hypothetical protein
VFNFQNFEKELLIVTKIQSKKNLFYFCVSKTHLKKYNFFIYFKLIFFLCSK